MRINSAMLEIGDSSNVEKVGYNYVTKQLIVVYKGGREYSYSEVPPEVFHEIPQAESVGKYINEHVKDTYQFVANFEKVV